ncbi:MGDG synthase family glycosyltransferase [Thermolongibacillus altinsuensis]|uniref:MGDG synthase family glycosyltransferase n=1 Tax=Thermolongibacillus altinsuensis TaxID=575256 RepID=UPI00242A2FD2|nr:UDP-N-acetylglucosamine--LPS N-acetylglucosamine transferase [Thermolongibacillus altinsuensis]GMB09926.1 putative glycosyltransferase YkoN [Thermolongibacillus altinsuensis]
MKILVLPLFQMQSGHHQVADTLIYSLQRKFSNIVCKKLDFLSYCNEQIEKRVADFYLRWISVHPHSYEWMYNRWMKKLDHSHLEPWRFYFERKMKRLIEEEQPDFIICTHSFPSHILERLKKQRLIEVPVVNVYTDFFINGVWGKTAIDYHFVPHQEAKEELVKKYNVPKENVIVTGIPVHEQIVRVPEMKKGAEKKHILVAGGNQGLGKMKDFLKRTEGAIFTYSVLCGKNEELYNELMSWDHPSVRPLPYISCPKEMNALYDQADAIVTKPGGVTMSEALLKKLPAFTISYLPGQEHINLRYLMRHGLIYRLSDCYERQLEHILRDEMEMNRLERRMKEYEKQIEQTAQEALEHIIEKSERRQKLKR